MTLLRQRVIISINSIGLFFCTSLCFAERLIKPVPSEFEHQFYEDGTDAYVFYWGKRKLRYDPKQQALKDGEKIFHLKDGDYPGIKEADFSEAKFYKIKNDDSFICFDFGFSGIMKSGNFQRFRGAILLHDGAERDSTLFYLSGEDIGCERLAYGKSFTTSSK
jgi:hypothetical protein